MRRIALGALLTAGLALPSLAHADALQDAGVVLGTLHGSLAHRYNLHDDRGGRMDGLDIVQPGPGRYVGVYHTGAAQSFALQVATSTDMVTWTHRATIDSDASQGTLAVVPGGGFVVAYEKAFWPVAPARKPLRPQLPALGRQTSELRFRAYPDLAHLLDATQSAEFTATRRLGIDAEGTPNIQWIAGGPDPAHLIVAVGFHYYADLDGNSTPEVDRQATGTLTGFAQWTQAPAPLIDAEFLHPAALHPGFSVPPAGNLGDRDEFRFRGRLLAVDEVQYVNEDFGSWRVFLRDPATGATLPLSPRTRGRSRAFANPSITPVTTPSGRRALFVSLFLPAEGAAPGENGQLIYVVPVSRHA